MNSKEVITRALEFRSPNRIPIICPSCGYTDVINIQLKPDKNWCPNLPKFEFINSKTPGNFIDEWGCIWTVTGKDNMGQVTGHPLVDFKYMKNYNFPNPYAPGRFEEIINNNNDDKYILFWIPFTLFERLYMLHGFDKTMVDLYLDRKNIIQLLDIILNFNLEVIDQIGKNNLKIDGIGITDDWGTGQSTFISLNLWREIFKNKYKQIIDLSHKYGFHVWMHSDGKINEFIPDFIELGLDAINLPSPKVVGIKEIGLNFNGKICFFTGVDNQTTLISGSKKEIEDEAKLIIKYWGSKKGGIIFYFDDDNWEALGINSERKLTVFNILKKLEDYFNY